MAIVTVGKDNRGKMVQTGQDRPIPIETHGLNDAKLSSIVNLIRQTLPLIKDLNTRKVIEELLFTVDIVRQTKTQFDSTRDNIEILWRRVGRLLETNSSANSPSGTSGSNSVVASPPTIPSIIPSIKDLIFFAYGDEVQTVNGTEIPLRLNVQKVSDAPYSHVIDSSVITLNSAGDYEFDIDASFVGSSPFSMEMKLQKCINGVDFVDVEGAISRQSS